jgi:hypothetical protein
LQRWKIVLLSLLAILLLAVIGLVRWMRPYDLETERNAARAAGIPLTDADLHIPVPPASENAASEYKGMIALEERRRFDTRSFDAATKSTSLALMDDRQARALKALLESRPDVGRLVHAAAAKPHAYFPHEWNMDALFPQFAQMREGAKWIRWESVLMAREGRYADAVRNQALGFRFAAHAAEEPILIGHLVSIACDGLTLSGFQDILAVAGPNASVASAVRREIDAYDPHRDLLQCLRCETLYGLNAMRQMTSAADIRALSAPAPAPWKPAGRKRSNGFQWLFLDPSEAVYLHWMTRIVLAAGTPASGREAAVAAVQAEIEQSGGKRPTYMMTYILTPVFAGAIGSETRSMARRALTLGMADVMAYRGTHGRWPETLAAASRSPLMDPYTGKPLEYRLDGAGFVLSAQPNVAGEDAKTVAKMRRANTLRYPPQP